MFIFSVILQRKSISRWYIQTFVEASRFFPRNSYVDLTNFFLSKTTNKKSLKMDLEKKNCKFFVKKNSSTHCSTPGRWRQTAQPEIIFRILLSVTNEQQLILVLLSSRVAATGVRGGSARARHWPAVG